MPSGSRASAIAPVLRAMWRRQCFSVARNASSATHPGESSRRPAFCAPISRPSSARRPRSTLLSVLIGQRRGVAQLSRHLVERNRRAVFQLQLDFADRNDRRDHWRACGFRRCRAQARSGRPPVSSARAWCAGSRSRRSVRPALRPRWTATASRVFGIGNELQIGLGRAELALVFAAVGGERAARSHPSPSAHSAGRSCARAAKAPPWQSRNPACRSRRWTAAASPTVRRRSPAAAPS